MQMNYAMPPLLGRTCKRRIFYCNIFRVRCVVAALLELNSNVYDFCSFFLLLHNLTMLIHMYMIPALSGGTQGADLGSIWLSGELQVREQMPPKVRSGEFVFPLPVELLPFFRLKWSKQSIDKPDSLPPVAIAAGACGLDNHGER
ncbi:hypothetical protein KSP39_PZI013708 [Platanthera zijinensis]|uniref:Uncharacterized protein n=1 Tax=Platanthera zijinensis TaxID=2320716 RepID=A0AAP0BCS0_9ASPA